MNPQEVITLHLMKYRQAADHVRRQNSLDADSVAFLLREEQYDACSTRYQIMKERVDALTAHPEHWRQITCNGCGEQRPKHYSEPCLCASLF